jgi:uncharacterized membrane protein YcaP (DUF421 family)
MSKNTSQLQVDGLTELQLEELQAAIQESNGEIAVLEKPRLGKGVVGEPVTLTVAIALTPVIVSAVVVWVAKQKDRSRKRIKYKRIDANGAEESFEMDETSYKEGKASSAALQAFPAALKAFLDKGLANGPPKAG